MFFFNVMIILCVVWMFGVWRSLDKALNVKNVPLLVLFSKLPFICFHVYFLSFFNWLLSPLQLSLHQCLFFFSFSFRCLCFVCLCVFFSISNSVSHSKLQVYIFLHCSSKCLVEFCQIIKKEKHV